MTPCFFYEIMVVMQTSRFIEINTSDSPKAQSVNTRKIIFVQNSLTGCFCLLSSGKSLHVSNPFKHMEDKLTHQEEPHFIRITKAEGELLLLNIDQIVDIRPISSKNPAEDDKAVIKIEAGGITMETLIKTKETYSELKEKLANIGTLL